MRKLLVVGTSVLGLGVLGTAALLSPTNVPGHPTLYTSSVNDERPGGVGNLGAEYLGDSLVLSENKYWESHGMN